MSFAEYDTQSDTWSQKADFPGGEREGGTSFARGGKGYYAFGRICGVI
jgi:N-acetylneuraminic acid mutarotase